MCTWEKFLENDNMVRMKKIVRCSHCEDALQDPITLMCCQHNFCMLCLEEIKAKQTNPEPGVLCPVCKEFSREDNIRQSDLVVKIVEFHHLAVKEKEKRDAIRRWQELKSAPDPAKWKCMDCSVYICDTCKTRHLRTPMLKGHYIIPLGQKDDPVTTSKHRDKAAASRHSIKHDCVDCEKGVCNRHMGVKDRDLSTAPSKRTSTENGIGVGAPDTDLESERSVTSVRNSFEVCKEALDRSLEEKIAQLRKGHARSLRRLMIQHEMETLEMEENCEQLEQRERELRELKEVIPKHRKQINASEKVVLLNKMTNGELLRTLEEAGRNGSRNLLVQVVKPGESEESERIKRDAYLKRIGYRAEELILPTPRDELGGLETKEQTKD